jgi:N-acetylmuramoyl-L-alanine amidase
MTSEVKKRSLAGAALIAISAAALAFVLGAGDVGAASSRDIANNGLGEAGAGAVTVPLAPPVADVRIYGAKTAGRPIVVIDAGHGGRDPGATSVSGGVTEKQLTLAVARELRDQLVERGRVRVAMTREEDRYLTLEERAEIARKLGASMFLSLHMDSAPNPLARGASVYSLSDVASDAEAARFAAKENRAGSVLPAADGSVRSILSDLALRDQMEASAGMAARLVRKAAGRVLLRPEPHRFADFHVLRTAGVPAVLVEAGYISNVDDEALLTQPEQRAKLVLALAQAVEADVASRNR